MHGSAVDREINLNGIVLVTVNFSESMCYPSLTRFLVHQIFEEHLCTSGIPFPPFFLFYSCLFYVVVLDRLFQFPFKILHAPGSSDPKPSEVNQLKL